VQADKRILGGLHLLEQFKGFIGYTDDEFKELWEKAIFVVDTNILINFYKYTSMQSTKSLLDILKKLKENGRLWIPHQVALEYFFNYEENMSKQKEGYDLLGKELKKLKEDAQKTLSTVKSKHPYIMTEKYQFYIDDLAHSNEQLQELLDNEIENLPDSKEIQQDLLNLLDGIIGEPYSQSKINELEKEGKDRYQHDIPPGFKDRKDNNKQGYRTYGDFRYQQLYGDLIVWYQIMDRAKDEHNPTTIILITEDRKDDWWEKDGQKIKRPHPQLIQEFFNKTQQKFYMYRTENFVRKAMEYLGADVTEEQVQEVTKELEQIRRSEEKEQSELEAEFLEAINRDIDKEKVKRLNLNKLMEFLTQEEKETFRKRLDIAFSVNTHPSTANAKYNHSIDWAIKISIRRLEDRLSNLLSQLATKDYEKVQSYIPLLDSFPDNSAEKGMLLLEYIEKIEAELQKIELKEFGEKLPF